MHAVLKSRCSFGPILIAHQQPLRTRGKASLCRRHRPHRGAAGGREVGHLGSVSSHVESLRIFKRRAPQIPEKRAMRCGGALVPSAQPSPSASTVRYNITGKPPDKPNILIVPFMSYVAVRGKGPSMTTSTGSSGAAGSLGPTITMTSRSRTATSATSTRPSSRATLFKSSRCLILPCWRVWPST